MIEENRKRFAELIRGKSVSIVGRAEYLNGLEQCEKIENSDIVIRLHSNLPYPSPPHWLDFDDSGYFVPASHHSRIGRRVDAYAPQNLCHWSDDEADRFISDFVGKGCKWLISHRPYHIEEGLAKLEPGLNNRLAILDYVTDKGLPIFVTPESTFQDLMRQMDYAFPMPGTSLIHDIIQLNPASLYITGFSCFMDCKHLWEKAMHALTRNHKPLYDLRYLRDAYVQGTFETDAVMLRCFDEHLGKNVPRPVVDKSDRPPLLDFEEKSTRLNKEYAEFLRGKSVCVVGRAGLENMEQGEFIDSHDVVVRIHELWPWEGGKRYAADLSDRTMTVPERWRSRIGSKCHVLFPRVNIQWVDKIEEKLSFWKREVEAFRVNGGQFLCGESWCNHGAFRADGDKESWSQHCAFDEAMFHKHFDIRYLTIDHWLNTLRELVLVLRRTASDYLGNGWLDFPRPSPRPYSGTLVAADILRYDVERVYITGMPNNLPDRSPIENRANLGFLVSLADRFPERVSIDKNMREMWDSNKLLRSGGIA